MTTTQTTITPGSIVTVIDMNHPAYGMVATVTSMLYGAAYIDTAQGSYRSAVEGLELAEASAPYYTVVDSTTMQIRTNIFLAIHDNPSAIIELVLEARSATNGKRDLDTLIKLAQVGL